MLQQFVDDPCRVGSGLINLVDRHDNRRTGCLGVLDGFDGLRHHTIVRGDDEDHDIGDISTARPHGGERRVAGGVEEGDALTALQPHLIGPDMLGNATVFATSDIGRT